MKAVQVTVSLHELTQPVKTAANWGNLALQGLNWANSNKELATLAGSALFGAGQKALSSSPEGRMPHLVNQVNLVDPRQQFAKRTNVYGMNSYAPLSRSYNQVMQDRHRFARMHKTGSFLGRLAGAIVPFSRGPGNDMNAPLNPAQAAVMGDQRQINTYDRGRFGLMSNQLATPAQRRRQQRNNYAMSNMMARQNMGAAMDAHRRQIDNWVQRGERGLAPRFQSAERMMGASPNAQQFR